MKVTTRNNFKNLIESKHLDWSSQQFWNYYKRQIQVTIPQEMMADFLAGTVKIKWSDNKWQIFDMWWDYNTKGFCLACWHESLPSIPEGEVIPHARLEETNILKSGVRTFAVVWGT